MNHYSTIVKNKIESDMECLKAFKYGKLFSENLIIQGQKSIGVNYRIYSAYEIEYELMYFSSSQDIGKVISLEEVDELFVLTAEEQEYGMQLNRAAS
jgi:hypothetical protein